MTKEQGSFNRRIQHKIVLPDVSSPIGRFIFKPGESVADTEKVQGAIKTIAQLAVDYYVATNKPRVFVGRQIMDWENTVSFDIPSSFLVDWGYISAKPAGVIRKRHERKTGEPIDLEKEITFQSSNVPFNRVEVKITPLEEARKQWKISVSETYIDEEDGFLRYGSDQAGSKSEMPFRREDLVQERFIITANMKGGTVDSIDSIDSERRILDQEIKIGENGEQHFKIVIDSPIEIDRKLSVESLNTTLAFLFVANKALIPPPTPK